MIAFGIAAVETDGPCWACGFGSSLSDRMENTNRGQMFFLHINWAAKDGQIVVCRSCARTIATALSEFLLEEGRYDRAHMEMTR